MWSKRASVKVGLLLFLLLTLIHILSHQSIKILKAGVVLEPESNVDVIEDSVDSGSEPANSEADIVPFDMGLLNQCLEKGYMQHYTAYYDKAEEMFPGIPVMRVGRGFNWWRSSPTWGGHKWYFSPSKHLTYLMNHKVGSMSFRQELGYCEKTDPIGAKGVPCDFLNRNGRPFREIDASGGDNFAQSNIEKRYIDKWMSPGSRFQIKLFFNNKMIPKSWVDPQIEKVLENSIKFTFVTDSISKFIGGFLERPFYTLESQIGVLTSKGRRMDYHYKPQMWHLYNAALASSAANGGRFTPPLDFVGKLNKKEAQFHWSALRKLVDEKFHEGSKFINPRLVKTNGAALNASDFDTLKEKLNIPTHTLLRAIEINQRHDLERERLGRNGRPATMQRHLARQLCAFAYAEYFCFQIPFPPQCTDDNGVYNVTEYEMNT